MLGNTSDIHARVLNFTSKKLLALRFIAHKFVVMQAPSPYIHLTFTSHGKYILRPSPFFSVLLLLCIILIANRKAKTGGLGTRLGLPSLL